MWMTVDWAGLTVSGPASVGNATVDIKLHIQVNILLFYKSNKHTPKTDGIKYANCTTACRKEN